VDHYSRKNGCRIFELCDNECGGKKDNKKSQLSENYKIRMGFLRCPFVLSGLVNWVEGGGNSKLEKIEL